MKVSFVVPTVEEMQAVGEAIAQCVLGGDLIMLNGSLGAGKTTMTQGIARGLGVRGKVASPTFVIGQIHHGTQLDLVHVDAYRLETIEELDALDLDTTLDICVTVVEWGAGKVEALSQDRLEIAIDRPHGGDIGLEPEDLFGDAPRTLTFSTFGQRGKELLAQIMMQSIVLELTADSAV